MSKVTVVLDSMAGSCGKGKFIGYLAQHDNYNVAVDNFMTNAGHTYVTNGGVKIMTQHVPTSMVNPDTELVIGPGAAITPSTLFTEIVKYRGVIGDRHIFINPRAVVILPKHKEEEQRVLRSGSTFKGCGAAQAEKVMRQAILFGDWYENTDWSETEQYINYDGTTRPFTDDEIAIISNTIRIIDTTWYLNASYGNGCDILVEGSQGCDLDINHGLAYPNTTSRQCHAGQLLADCGLSPRLCTDIIMIMRPYPIRISNVTNLKNADGTTLVTSSGDYAGSPEITWEEVRKRCGAPVGTPFGEMTTVTKKTRRVFEMNWDRLQYTTILNRPTAIAINFIQYVDYNMMGASSYKEITYKAKKFIDEVERKTGVQVAFIGTGPRNCDIIDLR